MSTRSRSLKAMRRAGCTEDQIIAVAAAIDRRVMRAKWEALRKKRGLVMAATCPRCGAPPAWDCKGKRHMRSAPHRERYIAAGLWGRKIQP